MDHFFITHKTETKPLAPRSLTENKLFAMSSDLLISFSEFESSDSSISFVSLPAVDPLMAYPQEVNDDVQLEVSGHCFVLSSRDFQRLAALPWQRIHGAAYRLDDVSPGAFEKCLDFVLFSQLPKKKKMSSDEKQELASVARTLNMTELVNHVSSKRGSAAARTKKRPTTKQQAPPRKGVFGGMFGSRSRTADLETAYGRKQVQTKANMR